MGTAKQRKTIPGWIEVNFCVKLTHFFVLSYWIISIALLVSLSFCEQHSLRAIEAKSACWSLEPGLATDDDGSRITAIPQSPELIEVPLDCIES